MKLIRKLRERNIAILLTTHYMEEAERLCDRLLLLQNGKVVGDGTQAELLTRIAGKCAIEIYDFKEEKAREMANALQTWYRPLSDGFVIGLRDRDSSTIDTLFPGIEETGRRVRSPNLEDVFFVLTGAQL